MKETIRRRCLRFVTELPWLKLGVVFVVLVILGLVVLVVWGGGLELWNSEAPDGSYYLRAPLIGAGAVLLTSFVGGVLFHLAQLDCR